MAVWLKHGEIYSKTPTIKYFLVKLQLHESIAPSQAFIVNFDKFLRIAFPQNICASASANTSLLVVWEIAWLLKWTQKKSTKQDKRIWLRWFYTW